MTERGRTVWMIIPRPLPSIQRLLSNRSAEHLPEFDHYLRQNLEALLEISGTARLRGELRQWVTRSSDIQGQPEPEVQPQRSNVTRRP